MSPNDKSTAASYLLAQSNTLQNEDANSAIASV